MSSRLSGRYLTVGSLQTGIKAIVVISWMMMVVKFVLKLQLSMAIIQLSATLSAIKTVVARHKITVPIE